MLLEAIKLENFRQFRHAEVRFAQGMDGRNVTIILGQNATGKTTFAQAFVWCLYGKIALNDKVLLNRHTGDELRPNGNDANVRVELKLRHGDTSYVITRDQSYWKDYNGKIKAKDAIFNVAKTVDGNTQYVKPALLEGEIKNVLPEELSGYFFFDGERIDRMGKEINTGRKATDFASAVKGLLGLNAMDSALTHLNPNSSRSVVGLFENAYDANSDSKLAGLNKTIQDCNVEIERIDHRLEELGENISAERSRLKDKEAEIKQYAEGEKLQRDREKALKNIDDWKKQKVDAIRDICRIFQNEMKPFFSLGLINDAMDFLKDKDLSGKDIPYMHEETIKYLLRHGSCICGTCLVPGSEAYKKLEDLRNYLPPQSISTTVGDFKREAARRADAAGDLMAQVNQKRKLISRCEDNILDAETILQEIEKKFQGQDISAKVKNLNDEIRALKDKIQEDERERDRRNQDKGSRQRDKERAETQRQQKTMASTKNRQIEIGLEYAKRIYEELFKEYSKSEYETRAKLEREINDIFRQIFAGNLTLRIDDKYRITVDGNVETSTSQSITVILAFIAGIIKLARENQSLNDESLLTSEPYPLVMDAPLSAFDKERIASVCQILPKIVEQVIIFIKDTDGELAETYMGQRIGQRYTMQKIDDFETCLEKEG